MILSASRRTDLPSLYGPWLLGRLEAGRCSPPSPTGPATPPGCSFSPETVDAIVFWTKNSIPFLPLLGEVEALGYRDFLFQYTITALDTHWEPGLPPLEERLTAFEKLAQRLGPARVDWRFDPILLDSERTPAWYARRFEGLCRRLAPCTTRCVLSFVDHYAHNGSLLPRGERPPSWRRPPPAWGRWPPSTACPCTPAPRPGTTPPAASSMAPASTASGWAGWWAAPSRQKRTAASALPAAAWKAWISAPTTPVSTGAATATPPAAPPPPQDITPPTIPSRPCSPVGRRRTGQFRKSVRPLLKKGSFPCFSGSWKIPPC